MEPRGKTAYRSASILAWLEAQARSAYPSGIQLHVEGEHLEGSRVLGVALTHGMECQRGRQAFALSPAEFLVVSARANPAEVRRLVRMRQKYTTGAIDGIDQGDSGDHPAANRAPQKAPVFDERAHTPTA